MTDIPLSQMLTDLRAELIEAQQAGSDQPLQFEIQDIELELQMTTTQETNGKGKVHFWVFNAQAGAKAGHSGSHTIRLRMNALAKAKGSKKPKKYTVGSSPTALPE